MTADILKIDQEWNEKRRYSIELLRKKWDNVTRKKKAYDKSLREYNNLDKQSIDQLWEEKNNDTI